MYGLLYGVVPGLCLSRMAYLLACLLVSCVNCCIGGWSCSWCVRCADLIIDWLV